MSPSLSDGELLRGHMSLFMHRCVGGVSLGHMVTLCLTFGKKLLILKAAVALDVFTDNV